MTYFTFFFAILQSFITHSCFCCYFGADFAAAVGNKLERRFKPQSSAAANLMFVFPVDESDIKKVMNLSYFGVVCQFFLRGIYTLENILNYTVII